MNWANFLAGGVAALAFTLPAAHAQEFPTRPINLIIPLAPGDATDIAGRAVAEGAARDLGVPVVPVNRPGAGGSLGVQLLVKAKPDGYTLVLANNASLVFRSILEPAEAGYNPLTDLTPLGLAMRSPTVIAVRSDAPFKTFGEMIDYAKRNPGKVHVGTAGVASVGDFCIRMINSATGADLVAVPFNGATPALTALSGGHVEGIVLALGAMSGQLRSGALRGIVTSDKHPDFPDIPTMAEVGQRQPLFGIWVAYFAPAGLAPEAAAKLVPALERAIRSGDIAAKLKPLGMLSDYSPPQKLLEEIRSEHARVLEIAKQAGLAK